MKECYGFLLEFLADYYIYGFVKNESNPDTSS